ncbi:MAG: hypothetical protein QXS37_06095 [Candidatus Aenigmatarchaeota archaeon]
MDHEKKRKSEEEIREYVERSLEVSTDQFFQMIDEIVEFIENLDEEETKTLMKVLIEKLDEM